MKQVRKQFNKLSNGNLSQKDVCVFFAFLLRSQRILPRTVDKHGKCIHQEWDLKLQTFMYVNNFTEICA